MILDGSMAVDTRDLANPAKGLGSLGEAERLVVEGIVASAVRLGDNADAKQYPLLGPCPMDRHLRS